MAALPPGNSCLRVERLLMLILLHSVLWSVTAAGNCNINTTYQELDYSDDDSVNMVVITGNQCESTNKNSAKA